MFLYFLLKFTVKVQRKLDNFFHKLKNQLGDKNVGLEQTPGIPDAEYVSNLKVLTRK